MPIAKKKTRANAVPHAVQAIADTKERLRRALGPDDWAQLDNFIGDVGALASLVGIGVVAACPCESVCSCKKECTNECNTQCTCHAACRCESQCPCEDVNTASRLAQVSNPPWDFFRFALATGLVQVAPRADAALERVAGCSQH